jgi:hypothetical protein
MNEKHRLAAKIIVIAICLSMVGTTVIWAIQTWV